MSELEMEHYGGVPSWGERIWEWLIRNEREQGEVWATFGAALRQKLDGQDDDVQALRDHLDERLDDIKDHMAEQIAEQMATIPEMIERALRDARAQAR